MERCHGEPQKLLAHHELRCQVAEVYRAEVESPSEEDDGRNDQEDDSEDGAGHDDGVHGLEVVTDEVAAVVIVEVALANQRRLDVGKELLHLDLERASRQKLVLVPGYRYRWERVDSQ